MNLSGFANPRHSIQFLFNLLTMNALTLAVFLTLHTVIFSIAHAFGINSEINLMIFWIAFFASSVVVGAAALRKA